MASWFIKIGRNCDAWYKREKHKAVQYDKDESQDKIR